ncbi:MAG: TraI domain-containing protein [Rhodospirillaceae bacterium]|nr:TraI domain-containing protein [Rhodospirillaceae bacterium]
MWQVLKERNRTPEPESPVLLATVVVDGPPLALVPATALLGEALQPRLMAMRLESGLEETEFNHLILGPIRACADWVQQLPATRDEHHREAGGLVRAAVESASVAMRRADGKLFHRPGQEPAGGVRSDTAWRYAAVLGALFTTIGDGLGRWRVCSAQGDHAWNPYAMGLSEWLPALGAQAYRVTATAPGDNVSRAGAGAWLAARCLGAHRLERFSRGDAKVMGALVDVLGGHTRSTLGSIVEDAKNAIRAEDRNRSRPHPTKPPPVEQQLLSVMRRLVQYRWNVNQPQGRLLLGPDAVYLQWRSAAEDILVRWRADHQGSPDVGPQELAQMLLEHGLVQANTDAPGGPSPIFHVSVKMAGDEPRVPIMCVRLPDPRIFGLDPAGARPVMVEVVATPESERQAEPARPAAGPATGDAPAEHDAQCRRGIEGADGGPEPPAPAPGGPSERPPAPERVAGRLLPGLARYGELGKTLSRVAKQQGALSRIEDGVALRAAALKGLSSRRRFLEQARQQGILADDDARSGPIGGEGPNEAHIVLVPRMAKLLGMADPAREHTMNE